MSEPTLQLPSELKYGYVEAQIILAVADTAADPDRLPDAQPASGTITLTPVESKRLYTESGPPVLVGKHSITGTLDSHGRLRDSQSGQGICVVVGQYNVSYSLQGISVDSHPILVTEDHTKDEPLNLVDLVPFDPPATPGQFELLNARIDAESVIDKAPVVVLTNPEEIPTDVAGRIDLVFTEPTTVHFQSPVRTDIVLSIEGYEHITWSGVAVHGLPDATGVVWASAMWRDRDSTWHLLCEQDTSQGGGGGASLRTWTFIPQSTEPSADAGGVIYRDSAGYPTGYRPVDSSETPVVHKHLVGAAVDPDTGQTYNYFSDDRIGYTNPEFVYSAFHTKADFSGGFIFGAAFAQFGQMGRLSASITALPVHPIVPGWSISFGAPLRNPAFGGTSAGGEMYRWILPVVGGGELLFKIRASGNASLSYPVEKDDGTANPTLPAGFVLDKPDVEFWFLWDRARSVRVPPL